MKSWRTVMLLVLVAAMSTASFAKKSPANSVVPETSFVPFVDCTYFIDLTGRIGNSDFGTALANPDGEGIIAFLITVLPLLDGSVQNQRRLDEYSRPENWSVEFSAQRNILEPASRVVLVNSDIEVITVSDDIYRRLRQDFKNETDTADGAGNSNQRPLADSNRRTFLIVCRLPTDVATQEVKFAGLALNEGKTVMRFRPFFLPKPSPSVPEPNEGEPSTETPRNASSG